MALDNCTSAPQVVGETYDIALVLNLRRVEYVEYRVALRASLNRYISYYPVPDVH